MSGGGQYTGDMTPEQESRTIQSAKLRATWQRFATSHQLGDVGATNSSLDVHLTEMRSVYGFQHDNLLQSLTTSLSTQQQVQLNLKNHQHDLPKILAKELENQMSYAKQMIDSGEGDPTIPLSRAHGLILYLVILSRCSENIPALSEAQLDVCVSFAALVAAEIMVWVPTNNANLGAIINNSTLNANISTDNANLIGGSSKQAVSNWVQAIILEITCYYSFMCDRQNNWINIVKSHKEELLIDAIALEEPSQAAVLPTDTFSHSVINQTARGNFRLAINAVFNSKECKMKQKLLALDLLGTFLCGGETSTVILHEPCCNHSFHSVSESSCGIINDSTFESLLALLKSCPDHRDLVVQCVLMYIQQTHNSRPDKRQIDVRSLLSMFLHEISLKAEEREHDMLSHYIDLIPRILRVRDRPSLQSSFLGVAVFDKILPILTGCHSSETVVVSCIRAYSALMRKSSSSKEEFEMHIGYERLLKTFSHPSLNIIYAVLDMIVEGNHKAEFAVIENLELLKVLLKWSFTMPDDSEHKILSYILESIYNIVTVNTLSVMRCSSGGVITIITSFLASPSRTLTPSLVEQLLCILDHIGGYSISAIEVRQFILLFQIENKVPNFTERLQVSLERMAKGKGAEGPNHFFDLQHQTAGITVPEITVWPHGKNCYTFVCWFKLDVKSAGRRPMSPDTTSSEERYTLYSFYNASGYGFEAFFQPNGTLHIAVCNRKEFTTTSVDHNFMDNKWHFLGISHRGSPLLGMGEVCVRIDKKLTNKLQLASINCSQPFTSNTIGGAGMRQANSKDRRGSGNILTEFGSFISSKTTANKDINVVTVTPGLQDEHYGIPTSLHGQLGPVALFWESLTPQELIDIHTVGLNNLSLFQPHYAGPRMETLGDLADKLILYYNAKASKDHVVLDLVATKIPSERLDGRLTGHNLSTWNIKDILACVGGVQLIFPLLESIGPAPEVQTSTSQSQIKPPFLRSHYTSDASIGLHGGTDEVGEDGVELTEEGSPSDFDMIKNSGSIQSLPDEPDAAETKNEEVTETQRAENRVARFIVLLEEMLRDCPTNQESLLSTNGFAVIGALLINIPPEELNMNLVKALQSLCLLLSYNINPINSIDEAYSPLLHDIYQHVLFNFELWSKVSHTVRVEHIQYLSVIIKDNMLLCRKQYGVQFMLDAIRLYCSSNIEQDDTACVLRRAMFGFVKFYMRHGIQLTEVKAILSFIAVTPDLYQKLEAIELMTVLVEVAPTSLPLARCLASQDSQDLLVGLLHTPCNKLKIKLLVLIRTIVETCCKNSLPIHNTQLCYVGEAITACSVDGNPQIVNEMLATVTINVTSATLNNQQPDMLLMQSLISLLPRFCLSTRLQVSQELLVLTRTNLSLGEQYSLLPAWYNAIFCLMMGSEQEEEGGLQDQLFVTIMELLHTILWRQYKKSGVLEKGQLGRILLTVEDLETRLFRSACVIKMRLFELVVHSMNLELKKSGYDGEISSEHTALLELLEHFMFHKEEGDSEWNDLSCVKLWSSKLVQEILLFFNLLGVWHGGSDMDLYRISLRVLLGCLHHQSYEYVSTAASKLHTLLDHPYFESYYTASYVLGALHFILAPTLEDEVNQLHILLVPLVHTALVRWGSILGLSQSALDQMPIDEHSPDFMDDFLMYVDTHEWETFISSQVYPAVAKFSKENNDTAVAATERQMVNTQELLEQDIILMNQAKMERLEGYEKDITAQFQKRTEFEINRHILDTNGRHNKHHALIREWGERKKFMTSDRGVWGGSNTPIHWKRDPHENYCRMRLRTCPNNHFDPHADAKFYDDNDVVRNETSANLLGVSEEARIRADRETQESWEVILNNNIPDVTDQDQLVFFEDCHLVTLLNIIPGTLKVSPTHIYFYEHEKDEEHHKMSHNNISWKINNIREIHLRRYNLRHSAIEFFLTDHTNHLINLSKYHRNKVYSKIMSLRPVHIMHGIARSPEEMVASSNITRKWMERRISNFEYLMNLNTIAGRTYNDLSQYPVFPWVLTDYDSDSIDLENPLLDCFRDLSKPIGAQVTERAEHADIKYKSLPQDGLDPPFHWGTHYSNPGAILYFLVRMEPYTTLHIDLHGRFDHPDRHFYSVGQSYDSSTRGQGDCKELIPEFFYLPDFLVNANNFDFGTRHDGKPLHDVYLPNWAKDTEDFIVKHRAALECDYVSNNINHWIDLIFGHKQRGPASIEALNVFHYTSYEGMVDLDNEKDPKKRRALEAQISNFGQTPRQIFKEPHPKRMTHSEASCLKGNTLHHVMKAPALKANAIQMGTPDNPVVFVGVSAGNPNQVIERGVMDNLVTISRNGLYGIHNWLARWTRNHPFYCEKDTQVEEGVRCISGPIAPGAANLCNLFRLSEDGRVLFMSGMWDNSLRVGQVNQHEISPLTVLYQHKNVVTCMELDGKYLATGGRDTTVVVWKTLRRQGECVGMKPHPSAILYGHNSAVTCVALSQELDLVVSGSSEGSVLIHTLKLGTYIRTVVPHVPGPENEHLCVKFVGIAGNGNIVITGKIPSKNAAGGFHSVIYLYTINGKMIKRAKFEDEVGAMFLDGERVVLGGLEGSLEIRDTNYINLKHKLRLKSGVLAISKDPRNQHLFVTTSDGKLLILTPTAKAFVKK